MTLWVPEILTKYFESDGRGLAAATGVLGIARIAGLVHQLHLLYGQNGLVVFR